MSAAIAIDAAFVPPLAANDNAALSARPKVNLRLAAQRRFDSQDQIPRRVYDSTGALIQVRKLAHGQEGEERSDYVRAAGKSIASLVATGPLARIRLTLPLSQGFETVVKESVAV